MDSLGWVTRGQGRARRSVKVGCFVDGETLLSCNRSIREKSLAQSPGP